MDGLVAEKAQLTSTLYYKGKGEITDPIVKKPATMTRQAWRAALKKSRRAVKLQRRAEERLPESVKLDNRLHAAGLASPRDARAIRPVKFDTQLLGA